MTYGDIKNKLVKTYRLVPDSATLEELQEYIIGRKKRLGRSNLANMARMGLEDDLEYVRGMIEEQNKINKK